MANPIYNYSSSYGRGGYALRGADRYLSTAASSAYPNSDSRSSLDRAKYSALDLGASSLYSSQGNYSASKSAGGIGAAATPSAYSKRSWSSVDGFRVPSSVDPSMKRTAEALYHQTILGSHNTSGQSDALFSTIPLVKRSRLEIASHLPIYPQRPGAKDCAHYMLTRTCKFGDACRFDHPIWVPEGGIPDWKEIPLIHTTESLPERPGEPDCPYYLKTQKCKFGFRCKFNHPKDNLNASRGGEGEDSEISEFSVLPERPSEPICSFYAKTGKCKFGANCKYHHPKDLQTPSTGQDTGSMDQAESLKDNVPPDEESIPAKTFIPFTPALFHNSKGLPIRQGETDCPFYLKTGSCKYGATCRYNHPDRNPVNPAFMTNLGHAIGPSPTTSLQLGVMNPAANLFPSIDPLLAQASHGVGPSMYPQRPGQIECDFYMKTGQCKFGERCKYHHPIDRSTPTALVAKQAQQNVKLTLAGLPRREGSVACPFYMKTGTCKYAATCRFDHPPPGEAIAMAAATVQGRESANGVAMTVGEEEDEEEEEGEEEEEAAGDAEEQE